MTQINWKSAYELSRMYRKKEVSPVEVVEAALSQHERVNPILNTMVTLTAESALENAKNAERRFMAGEELPDLYGVPLTVKDLTDTAGVRTTYGSVGYSNRVPSVDGIAWERLKKAGTILLGKTTSPEFGALGVTESYLTGTTGNPWAPARTSGGSSGGAAASVAAGVTVIALGSDGGGSIRVPASVCGVVGIKPTAGRIPTASNDDPDSTDGPIARRVVDAAMMLDLLVGPDRRDRLALPSTGENYTAGALRKQDLTGIRIGATYDFGQGPIDPETRRVFAAALEDLRSAGAVVEVVPISLPDTIDYFVAYWGPGYIQTVAELERIGSPIWPMISEIAAMAEKLSPLEISNAMRSSKTEIYDAFEGVFSQFDLLVTPTTPNPAFPHVADKGGLDMIDEIAVKHAGINFHRMTEPPSHAGLPAITVPCGFTHSGLPVGLQFVGPLYQDLQVVIAAAAFESIREWHAKIPNF